MTIRLMNNVPHCFVFPLQEWIIIDLVLNPWIIRHRIQRNDVEEKLNTVQRR